MNVFDSAKLYAGGPGSGRHKEDHYENLRQQLDALRAKIRAGERSITNRGEAERLTNFLAKELGNRYDPVANKIKAATGVK